METLCSPKSGPKHIRSSNTRQATLRKFHLVMKAAGSSRMKSHPGGSSWEKEQRANAPDPDLAQTAGVKTSRPDHLDNLDNHRHLLPGENRILQTPTKPANQEGREDGEVTAETQEAPHLMKTMARGVPDEGPRSSAMIATAGTGARSLGEAPAT